MPSTLRFAIAGLMLLTAVALGVVALNAFKPARLQIVAENVPPPLQTTYLVASRPLPGGTLAREEDCATKVVSVAGLPSGAIHDSADARTALRGSLVRNFIDSGNLITADNVLRPRDRGFIASVLQPGMRAVAIGVDPVSGVAGLIWPGDHVDVVLTQELKNASAANRNLGETILSNVRVIAIDQEMVQGAPADNATAGKLARTVTVQATQEQVEKLAVAQHLGRLSLSIRAALDEANDAGRMISGGDVSPALSRSDQPEAKTVLVIEGSTSRQVKFQ
jgi:pilus assembly protein CpaB